MSKKTQNYFAAQVEKDIQSKHEVLENQRASDSTYIRVNISLTPEHKRLLAMHRAKTGETASAFVRRAIDELLVS